MTAAEATAEVFWTAFKAMKPKERNAFLDRLIADPEIREDLLDAALIEERRGEPGRPFDQILAERRRRKGTRAR
jgi:hypothetical protein